VGRILDVVAPPRMGAGFRWLLASSWTSNLGDGIGLAAGPLLVASQTRNPVLVAMAAVLQRLPWLLFGLWAGAIADRVDRRLLVVVADLLRALVVALLCVSIVTGRVDVTVVLVTTFLFGVAEVFADSASGTLLPMLVPRADLGIGNARLQAGFLTTNQLVGPPVGAFLFAVGTVWPFTVQVLCVALGALLVARIATPPGAPRDLEGTHVRRDIADGLRWIRRNPPVRTLALVILAFNVTWGAAWSVLVLWSQDVLGMGPVGYGLLTTAVAVGGLVSTSSYDVIERRVPLATVMRLCLLLEVLTHLALALTRTGWLAFVIMVVFGAYAFVWGHRVADGADAGRADGVPGAGRVGLRRRVVPGAGHRAGARRRHRRPVGAHRTVLVRVRRVGPHPGARVAAAGVHRARRGAVRVARGTASGLVGPRRQ